MPARVVCVVCDYLAMGELTSVKVEHWGVAATQREHAEVKYPLCVPARERNLLVVNDVTDTGDTLRATLEYLEGKRPLEVQTAVLQHKATSRFTPDYYAEYLEDWRWIIYPWAAIEDLMGFIRRLLWEGPLSHEEIEEELQRRWSLDPTPQQVEDALSELERHGQAESTDDGWIA